MTKLSEEMKSVKSLVAEEMEKLLIIPKTPEKSLMGAMRYSVLPLGKALRPFLLITTAQMFDVPKNISVRPAACLELIHVAMQIHDDLPIMDNDDLRRGKPSNHKKYNEWTALLAGDALIARAFNVLAGENTLIEPPLKCELVSEMARTLGYTGLLGGQMLDMMAPQKEDLKLLDVKRMHEMKSAQLFVFACEAGAIMGKADYQARQALKEYAAHLGLIFQITDDLLDVEGSVEETGKDTRKDVEAGKATYVSFVGVDQARKMAKALVPNCLSALAIFGSEADLLRDLAKYMAERTK